MRLFCAQQGGFSGKNDYTKKIARGKNGNEGLGGAKTLRDLKFAISGEWTGRKKKQVNRYVRQGRGRRHAQKTTSANIAVHLSFFPSASGQRSAFSVN